MTQNLFNIKVENLIVLVFFPLHSKFVLKAWKFQVQNIDSSDLWGRSELHLDCFYLLAVKIPHYFFLRSVVSSSDLHYDFLIAPRNIFHLPPTFDEKCVFVHGGFDLCGVPASKTILSVLCFIVVWEAQIITLSSCFSGITMILTNTLINSNCSSKNEMWTFVEKISIHVCL